MFVAEWLGLFLDQSPTTDPFFSTQNSNYAMRNSVRGFFIIFQNKIYRTWAYFSTGRLTSFLHHFLSLNICQVSPSWFRHKSRDHRQSSLTSPGCPKQRCNGLLLYYNDPWGENLHRSAGDFPPMVFVDLTAQYPMSPEHPLLSEKGLWTLIESMYATRIQ